MRIYQVKKFFAGKWPRGAGVRLKSYFHERGLAPPYAAPTQGTGRKAAGCDTATRVTAKREPGVMKPGGFKNKT